MFLILIAASKIAPSPDLDLVTKFADFFASGLAFLGAIPNLTVFKPQYQDDIKKARAKLLYQKYNSEKNNLDSVKNKYDEQNRHVTDQTQNVAKKKHILLGFIFLTDVSESWVSFS